ncbi:NRDE family protein [Aurantibacillus circumpalustris]|uniref:NRDE family protein n=1 Tax=Aurantibacillus circumpalustris TaxID=3036359 RepID=UPI00295B34BA|nr:NRDE family protein [Aurantibacillus circumpalustris]
MCTVTYLPKGDTSFILTSNRDEDLSRPSALPINSYTIHNKEIYFPKDPKAGGTWIAKGNDFTVCLLNGAFVPHKSEGNYRKSRGFVLLDFFKYETQYDFIANYDFKDIEPFSLIFVRHQDNKRGLCELKWDGIKTHHLNHDASLPHIWSSVTLYSEEVVKERETWFYDWVKENEIFTKDTILMFHHFGGTGDQKNDIVMNRSQKRTVSICCVNKINEFETEMIYEDVINKKIYNTKVINS